MGKGSVLHYPPGDTRPDFDDAAMSLTANVNVDGVQTTYVGNPGSVTAPVHAVFMTSSISNDYVIDAGLNSLTDWVVTMPTKVITTKLMICFLRPSLTRLPTRLLV